MLIVQLLKKSFFFFEGFGLVAARPFFFKLNYTNHILGGDFKYFLFSSLPLEDSQWVETTN